MLSRTGAQNKHVRYKNAIVDESSHPPVAERQEWLPAHLTSTSFRSTTKRESCPNDLTAGKRNYPL